MKEQQFHLILALTEQATAFPPLRLKDELVWDESDLPVNKKVG